PDNQPVASAPLGQDFDASLPTDGVYVLAVAGDSYVPQTYAFQPSEVIPHESLTVSAPDSVTAGSAFDLTVSALDPNGNPDPNYSGTVQITSQDGTILVDKYGFTGDDQGTHIFSVTLPDPGYYTITATDLSAAEITGSTEVDVAPVPTDTVNIQAPE